jgi:hypothetical protein
MTGASSSASLEASGLAALQLPDLRAASRQAHQGPRMVVLEFNELCPYFLNLFMQEGRLPNFKRLHDASNVYLTDAGEDPPNLEPWIQWFTLHSGRPYSAHQVFHLGDGRNFDGKLVAQVLSDAGVKVGVFGSMNTNYEQLNGYYLPDPWDVKAQAFPGWLAPYYETVAKQVQESSRADAFTRKDMASFGLFALRHGLSLDTALGALRQLLDERASPDVRWRRACVLDHISYDVFRWLNRRLGVEFATFFSNSTAHFQHYYWRNQEPGRFQIPPSKDDGASLTTAVLHGYKSLDRLVGKVLRDYPQATVMMATALSQQPWDTTKCTYRPKDFDQLLRFAGVSDAYQIKPVMAEQFQIVLQDEAAALRVAALLDRLSVGGSPLLYTKREDSSLFSGCSIMEYGHQGDQVLRADGSRMPFDDLFYMIHGLRSGRHHRDGALWVRSAQHRVADDRVPLVQIAPAILRSFGVQVPQGMLV